MRVTVLAGLLLAGLTGFAQDYKPSAERITETVKYLSSDKLKGRGTEEKGGTKASGYVMKQFRKLGLEPGNHDAWYQDFTFSRGKHTDLRSRNVIGYLDNGAPYTIIIGAHYDHLGTAGLFDGRYPVGQIHNGADDNASGVAGLLELARYYIQNGGKEPFNFMFIAFGGEELGLQGSKYFTKNPVDSLSNVHFMLNMDMIGRYNPERGVGIGGYGSAEEWPEIFKGVQYEGIKFFTDAAGKGGSDHNSFYVAGVPVLFFHTGGHDDYHKPTDDAPKVKAKEEAGILEIAVQLINNAMKVDKLEYKGEK
ncbi:M20/M25/M40 family metallo-hydrolase [Chitinophaga barathri]|uniref:M20/M25/M40 family metallo-hydrolase n=1 Tax=Chitinophaga barathri TaxID=1647451 RepID=A0A3N4MGZ7_9BACT|nr:M20/M25/M40 family metallo-hydrolase [Chitinophaga barathri]RPD42705.1 M20/M25/M40 family metallo-hydrolase [Chitinophaga barathri]